jgi:hypothetical protein
VKAYSSPCLTTTKIAPDPFGSYGRRAGISLASSEYSWTFSPRTLSPLWKVKRTDQEKADKRAFPSCPPDHSALPSSRQGFVTPAVACWMYVRAEAEGMRKISYAGYRFPLEVIHRAIWLYLRFTLSFRDVEDLLAERGIAVSYETVRRWANHFGPMIAAHLRKRPPKPHATWRLDEVYLKIDGRMVYLWRAVEAEGEVLDVLVQSKRNKRAALKLMRKLLKKMPSPRSGW